MKTGLMKIICIATLTFLMGGLVIRLFTTPSQQVTSWYSKDERAPHCRRMNDLTDTRPYTRQERCPKEWHKGPSLWEQINN